MSCIDCGTRALPLNADGRCIRCVNRRARAQKVERTPFASDHAAPIKRALAASDWTQAADVQAEKSAAWRQAWREYRANLRKLLASLEAGGDVAGIVMPAKPKTKGDEQ